MECYNITSKLVPALSNLTLESHLSLLTSHSFIAGSLHFILSFLCLFLKAFVVFTFFV